MNSAQIKLKIGRIAVFVLIGIIFAAVLGWANLGEATSRPFDVLNKKIKILPAGMRGDSGGWRNGVEVFVQDLRDNAPVTEFSDDNSAYISDGMVTGENSGETANELDIEITKPDGSGGSGSETENTTQSSQDGGGSETGNGQTDESGADPGTTENQANKQDQTDITNGEGGGPADSTAENVPPEADSVITPVAEENPGADNGSESQDGNEAAGDDGNNGTGSESEPEASEPASEESIEAEPAAEPEASEPEAQESPEAEPEAPAVETLLAIVGEEDPAWMNYVAEDSDPANLPEDGATQAAADNTAEGGQNLQNANEENKPKNEPSGDIETQNDGTDSAMESADTNTSGNKKTEGKNYGSCGDTSIGHSLNKSFTLSKFSIDDSLEIQSIDSLQLRFSMGVTSPTGMEGEPNFLAVEYSNGGSEWATLEEFDLSQGVANDTNGGYFLVALPTIESLDEISDMEVRFVYEVNSLGSGQILYVDAVWIEANYTTPLPPDIQIDEWRQKIAESLFSEDENPTLVFPDMEDKKNFFQKIWSWIKGEKRNVSAKLVDPTGAEYSTKIEFDGERVLIKKDTNRQFRPGRYKLILTIDEGGQTETEEQTFEWGVLTVNSDKSIYKAGDQANLFFGVLDELGHTICDAQIILAVTDPEGNTAYPEVAASDDCGPNNVTDAPDYSASYITTTPGTYKIDVVSNSVAGTQEITDTFEALQYVEFEVTRSGPTRINPTAAYEMKLRVLANQDYAGTINDFVPPDFEISEVEMFASATTTPEAELEPVNATTTVEMEGNVKKISWEADMEAGKTYEFTYKFDAPDISPYIFLLGPLQIGNFSELRKWQIASDAITGGVATASGTGTAYGISGNGNLTVTLPTSWAVGQLAVLLMYCDQGSGSVPSNWAQVSGSPWGSSTPKLQAFYKTLASGESNPVTTISGSASGMTCVGAIATFNGVDTSSPIDAVGTASAGTGTPMTAAAATTATAGAWALGLCGRGDNENASSQTFGGSATGVSEIFDSGTGTGNDGQVSMYVKEIASAGTTGAGSAATSATDPWVSVIIALKPAPPVVSGGCYTDSSEGTACTDDANNSIKVAVNGVVQSGSDTTVDGSWSFALDSTPASGSILTFFVNGEDTESEEATTVVKYDGSGNIDYVKMYQSQLVIGTDTGSANSGQTIAISDMDTSANGYENSDDEDVLFDVTSGSDLTVDASNNKSETLYIMPGNTYQPASGGGGDTTTYNFYIEGTFTADSNTMTVGGSFTNAGTFTPGTGTMTFNGSDTWPYKKSISLTGQSGAGTDYSVKLLIGESSGATGEDFDLASHCTNFPNDIMFTDDDGATILGHWVESVSGTAPNRLATVWVKVADDLGSNQSIYIYYGKTGQGSIANGSAAFEVFADFTTSVPAGWTTPGVSAYVGYTFENGDLVLYGGLRDKSLFWNAGNSCYYTSGVLDGRIVETRYKAYQAGTYSSYMYDKSVGFGGGNWIVGRYQFANNWLQLSDNSTLSWDSTATWAGTLTGYYIGGLAFDGAYRRVYEDYSLQTSYYVGSSQAEGSFGVRALQGNSTGNSKYEGYYDWARKRKFVTTEPSFSSAGSESSSGIVISQVIPGYTYNNLNVEPAANNITAAFAPATITVGGNLSLGNGTNTGVTVSAAADPVISVTGNMTVNANTTFTGMATSAGTLNVDGNLTITGTFVAPAGTTATAFTLGGNFINNGTFTHNSGRITLDGNGGANNQTLNGSTTPTTFYQFYVTAGGTRTVYFKDGNHYAIAANGTFDLAGTSSFGLTVTRESTSSAWYLDVNTSNTTVSVLYTTASWSNASGGKEINATGGTNNDGNNNTNWVFVISNYPPTWSTHPHEDPTSDSTTPTNVGGNFVVKATAADTESNQYYLAICKTNAISANNNAAPTCTGGEWAISAATDAGSEATASYTVLATDTAESYAWYAFACDKTTTQYGCTSMDNDGTSGNNGTPFAVNHRPTVTSVVDDGPKNPGSTFTITAQSWADGDDDGAQDTGSLYVCKSNDFTGSACGAGGTWCSATGVTPPAGSWLSDYAYRVRIPVSATTAGAQTSYTKTLTIVQGSGTNTAGTIYLNSHALNWPIDIKFTADDGTTELSYYREEYDSTDGTWNIKMPSIAASGTTDFYVYYGKSDASDASDIDDANLFGEDFEAANFNNWWPAGSQWTIESSIKQSGNYSAKGVGAAANNVLERTQNMQSFAVRMWVRVNSTSNYFTYPLVGRAADLYYPILTYGGHFMYWTGTTAANLPTDKTCAADTWYKVEYAIDMGSDPDKIRWLYIKDGDAGSADLKDYNNNTIAGTSWIDAVVASSPTVTLYIDQIQIRKYAYPEPQWATPESEVAGSATLSCDIAISNPYPHGAVNYYPYVVDSHGLVASGGEHGTLNTFTVNDTLPTVSGTPTFNNSSAISLTNEKSTTDIYVRGIVTDDNGCGDTNASTTVDVWQTTLVGRSGCDSSGEASGNKCYYHATCTQTGTDTCDGGNDKTASYTCTVPFQYYANPTDANTPWSADNWTATFIPGDGQGANSAAETNTAAQEMNSFLSMGFATSYGSVAFGNMDANSHTDPLIESMRIEATGNCAVDGKFYGTSMTGPGAAIPSTNQHFAFGATAPAWSSGTDLPASEPGSPQGLGTCKSGYTATPEWKPVWWGIEVPAGQLGGDYTGTDYVVAVKKAWASTGDWCE